MSPPCEPPGSTACCRSARNLFIDYTVDATSHVISDKQEYANELGAWLTLVVVEDPAWPAGTIAP